MCIEAKIQFVEYYDLFILKIYQKAVVCSDNNK